MATGNKTVTISVETAMQIEDLLNALVTMSTMCNVPTGTVDKLTEKVTRIRMELR